MVRLNPKVSASIVKSLYKIPRGLEKDVTELKNLSKPVIHKGCKLSWL